MCCQKRCKKVNIIGPRLPSVQPGVVETPCGQAEGLVEKWKMDICLVSVVRSGKFMDTSLYIGDTYIDLQGPWPNGYGRRLKIKRS